MHKAAWLCIKCNLYHNHVPDIVINSNLIAAVKVLKRLHYAICVVEVPLLNYALEHKANSFAQRLDIPIWC